MADPGFPVSMGGPSGAYSRRSQLSEIFYVSVKYERLWVYGLSENRLKTPVMCNVI